MQLVKILRQAGNSVDDGDFRSDKITLDWPEVYKPLSRWTSWCFQYRNHGAMGCRTGYQSDGH
jgi:hypothetical protein